MTLATRIFFYFETHDTQAAENVRIIAEGGRTWEIDNRWSIRLDAPHHQNMQHHVHILHRGNDVCVINRDGTPSHHTISDSVPNWLMQDIKKRGLIERSMLHETASVREIARFTLPSAYIEKAELRAKMYDFLDKILRNRLRRLRGLRDS
jgi:hypothetical protein